EIVAIADIGLDGNAEVRCRRQPVAAVVAVEHDLADARIRSRTLSRPVNGDRTVAASGKLHVNILVGGVAVNIFVSVQNQVHPAGWVGHQADIAPWLDRGGATAPARGRICRPTRTVRVVEDRNVEPPIPANAEEQDVDGGIDAGNEVA